jgi:hypothetical protein
MFSKQQQQQQPPGKADKIVTKDKVDSKLVAAQDKPLELSSSLTVKVVDTHPTSNPPPKQTHSSLQQSLLDMQQKLNPTQESQDSQPDKPKEQRRNKAEPIVVNEKEGQTHQGDDDMEKEDLDRDQTPNSNKRTGRGGRGGFNRGRGTSSGRSSRHDVNPPHSLEDSRVSSTVAPTSHDMVRPVQQSTKPSSSTNQSLKDSAEMDLHEYQSSQVDTVKRDKGHTPRFQHKPRNSNTQGELQSDGTVRLTKGPSSKKFQTTNTNLKSADSNIEGHVGEIKPSKERSISVSAKINVDDIKESVPTEKDKRKERTGSTHHGKFKSGRGGPNT